MSDMTLRSLDIGFCVRCQNMAVDVPDGATSCDYDDHAPCMSNAKAHGGDGHIECATRDELVQALRERGFCVAMDAN